MSVEQMIESTSGGIKMNAIILINTICVGIMQFVIIFQAVSIFTDELRLGTVSFLFTNVKSRTEILISKILAMILFCLSIGFLNYILVEYYQVNCGGQVSIDYFCFVLGLYFVYSWFIGNFFLFIAVVFKSRSVSFVTGMFFIYLLSDIIKLLAEKISLPVRFLDCIPFSVVLSFLLGNSINTYKISGMIVGGFIFFVLSAFIFERQDLS